MNEESIKAILAHPAGTIGSDGLLGGEPHPRAFGSFPRILGKYVREEKVLPLENMIRRMTSQPARIIGLQDRGILREGMAADIVIFGHTHAPYARRIGKTLYFNPGGVAPNKDGLTSVGLLYFWPNRVQPLVIPLGDGWQRKFGLATSPLCPPDPP